MSNTAIATKDDSKLYESLALRGDLSALTPQDKARYYALLCERLGLDATTQPFSLLKLDGKEILYASRGCTDQLARIHRLNRQITKEEEIRGVYIVTVEAMLPDGRREQSKGAVSIEGLKGNAFCNAIMKAETKAKRRATLSILGLGMLDEVELETIPAYHPSNSQPVITEPESETITERIAEAREKNHPEPKPALTLEQQELIGLGKQLKFTERAMLKWLKEKFNIDGVKTVPEAVASMMNSELQSALNIFREKAGVVVEPMTEQQRAASDVPF